MTAIIIVLLFVAVLLAPFAVVSALASASRRSGMQHWHLGGFPVTPPMVGRLCDDPAHPDADARRLDHEFDAIRTRFEDHPAWPSSGATGERR